MSTATQTRTTVAAKNGGYVPFKLPATAAAKMRSLSNMVEEAWLLANKAKDRVARLLADKAQGIEVAPGEIADMEAAQARHLERHERTTSLLANLDRYVKERLENFREPVAEYIRPARVKVQEGASPQQQVQALQLKIIECRTAITAIEHAPMPRKDQVAVVERWVDRFVMSSKPRINVSKGEMRLSFNGIGSEYLNTASHMQVIAIAAFFADVDRDTLVKRLVDMLPPSDANAIPLKERESKIAELRDRMLQLERDEEATIVRAAEDGVHILRRADANPQAVLGIVVGSKARTAA